MAPPDLSNRVVIMTGGSRGLGRAMARGLLQAGAKVTIAAVDSVEEAVAEAETDFGKGKVVGVACDVRQRADCEKVVAETLKAFGKVDMLVNDAALGMRHVAEAPNSKSTKFWEADPDRWRDVIDVNVIGGFFMAHAVAPHLVKQGWGRIVNVTTSLGTMQRKDNSPYGVTKAAMEAATLIWSQELEGTGVTMNTLIPGGAANTTMVFGARGSSRLLPPEIMVPPILWLASTLSDGQTGGRYAGNMWDESLSPSDAAKKAKEEPVLRVPSDAQRAGSVVRQ
jgi:3-oxoacyl-[acyl-carrier protein] reductase